MRRLNISNGSFIVAAGWLLSALSVLGAVRYLMGLISGGIETPDFVVIELWAVLLAGALLSIYGALLLHNWRVFAFPVASGIIVFVLLDIALPSLVCAHTTCIPAGSHP